MNVVTVRFRAQSRLVTLVLVLLVALAVALLPPRSLLAAPDQGVMTPMAPMTGAGAAVATPAPAASEGHGAQMTDVDDHAPAAPTASVGHADEPAHESAAAHGDEAEAPATATRGLVLGGFGAVNGLVIVGAAIAKTRTGNRAKARRVSPPDTTTKGAVQ